MKYEEIDDNDEILRLNAKLTAWLRKALPHHEERIIGYPSNHFNAQTHFGKPRGENVFWWVGWKNKKNSNTNNLWGMARQGI